MINGFLTHLGPIEKFHLPTMVKWRNDPNLRKYFREYRELTLSHQEKWWEEKVLNKSSDWIYFTIRDRIDPETIIGACGLTYMHPVNRTAEIAIFIANPDMKMRNLFWSDALMTLCYYGFMHLNLNRLWIEAYSNNPDNSVYLDMGFHQDGILKETYYYDGKFLDSHIFSILKKDFNAVFNKFKAEISATFTV